MEHTMRCNACMTKFRDEEDLASVEETPGEFVKGCPKCKTDGFLMDAPFEGSL